MYRGQNAGHNQNMDSQQNLQKSGNVQTFAKNPNEQQLYT
jgi:hypothetical protein